MPRFEPFRALRYTGTTTPVDLADVASPPYDVIDAPARDALERRDPHNSVRLDFPHDEDGVDGYQLAARRLREWTGAGVLAVDAGPTFSVYRMTATGLDGEPFATVGVFGALGLEEPGTGDILPHEQTTPKDKADRLSLLTATEANLSPIWGLSLADGLGAALATVCAGAPSHVVTDGDGIVHELWTVADPHVLTRIRALVEGRPIVIADGHHRFETALAYARDRRRAEPGAPADAAFDAVLALVVELAEDQLAVRPIHRIVTGLPEDVESFLAQWFEVEPAPAGLLDGDGAVARLVEGGFLGLASPAGMATLRPRAAAFGPDISLDSERVATVLAAAPGANVRYHHDLRTVVAAGTQGGAAGVLLRPVTVDQIARVAHQRTRMPPKSTFFWPKPRTGMVFRPHDPAKFTARS